MVTTFNLTSGKIDEGTFAPMLGKRTTFGIVEKVAGHSGNGEGSSSDSVEILHYLNDYGNCGIFLIMGNTGFTSSTVFGCLQYGVLE